MEVAFVVLVIVGYVIDILIAYGVSGIRVRRERARVDTSITELKKELATLRGERDGLIRKIETAVEQSHRMEVALAEVRGSRSRGVEVQA